MDPVLELQGAIITRLRTTPAVTSLVPATRITDIAAPEYSPIPRISIGPSNYVTDDIDCAYGGEIMIQVDCVVDNAGSPLSVVRLIAGAVRSALRNWEPTLAVNALVTLDHMRTDFIQSGALKQASVRFTAIVEEP